MGRFYKTALPNFVDNFMYQPPWEMAMKSLAINEEGVQKAMASTELFKNLDVKYINDPVERENVEKIKQYYSSKADEITQAIQKDPMSWRSKLPELTKFGRELQDDLSTGNLSKIQGSYSSYQQWLKDNEKVKQDNPDLFNKLNQHWLGEWAKGNRSLDRMYSGQQIIKPIDITDKKYQDIFKEMKADILASPTSDGKYWYKGKQIRPEDVESAAYDMMMNDPNISGYLNQMGNILKDPGYYDESTGKLRNVFELRDRNGKVLTPEEANSLLQAYDKLSPEEKKSKGLPFTRGLNQSHAWTPGIRAMGNVYGFQENSYEEDKFALQTHKGQIDSALQAQRDAATMARLHVAEAGKNSRQQAMFNFKDGQAKEAYKNQLRIMVGEGGDKGKNAEELLKTLEAKETLGIIQTPDIAYKENISKVIGGDEAALSIEQNARDSARKNLKYKQGSEEHEFLKYYDGEILKGKNPDEIVENYVKTIEGGHFKKDFNLKYVKTLKDPYMVTPTYVQGKISGRLRGKYSDILEKYEKSKENYFTKYSESSSKVAVHPLSLTGNNVILSEINSNPSFYYSTDEKGNNTGEFTGISKIIGAVGGNSNGMVGYKAIDNNGNQTFIFPNNKYENTTVLNRNLIANNLNDPNSTLKNELVNYEVNKVANFINSAGINSRGFKSGKANIGGHDIPIEMSPEGVNVYSPSGQKIQTFKDINSLVKFVLTK